MNGGRQVFGYDLNGSEPGTPKAEKLGAPKPGKLEGRINGERIGALHHDLCRDDLHLTLAILPAAELGIVEPDDLVRAADGAVHLDVDDLGRSLRAKVFAISDRCRPSPLEHY